MSLEASKTIEFSVPTDSIEDLLLWQYRTSPNLYKYIEAFVSEIDILAKAVEDTINFRYLADAYGYQLDVIGEIVGIGRVFFGANPLGYFGFYDDPQSEVPSIGSVLDLTVGGIYKGSGDKDAGDLVLSDTTYRRAIYAKIIQNGSNCRINHVLTYIDYITGKICNTEITEGVCSAHIFIHEDLDQIQRVTVSLLINNLRPAGVSLTVEDNRGVIDVNPGVANVSITEFRRVHDF